MDLIRIEGGIPLKGTITISGAKNAALPLMAATLLTEEQVVLTNVPELTDIKTLASLLGQLGVEVRDAVGEENITDQSWSFTAGDILSTTAPYQLVQKMRASILVLGPLLARAGVAHVSLPGGCAIGPRPVDLHLRGLQQLGADIDLRDGYIHASAPKGLKGAVIHFPIVSVGATENLMMAASLAVGETVLENAAREPEVVDLANCLVDMGAEIEGIGSERIIITGVQHLKGVNYTVLPDRVETGTYAIAVAATGGEVELVGAQVEHIGSVVETLSQAGVVIEPTVNGLKVISNGSVAGGIDVMTQPYPGFPTDLQAQLMVLMSMAEGSATITEVIFENRFMHVPELCRMGADISVRGGTAMVRGVPKLFGAPVMATDLRASVSLVAAGLVAEGETVVSRVYHLDRGYERLVEKLSFCGARIERVRR